MCIKPKIISHTLISIFMVTFGYQFISLFSNLLTFLYL